MTDIDDLPPHEAPVELSAEAMDAFSALQARIAQDMEEQQGPWARMSALHRYWPMALALVFGLSMVAILPTGQLSIWFALACGTAFVAAIFCFASIFLATSKPAFSEKLSVAGLVIALTAFGLELTGAFAVKNLGFDPLHTLKCSGMYWGLSLIPMGILIYGLRRSGFPVRAFHAMGLTAAAMIMSSVGNWKMCTPDDAMHLALGHILIPAIVFPLAALLVWRLTRKSSKLK